MYKSYDELPLMLSVPEVAAVLGISRAGAYEIHQLDRQADIGGLMPPSKAGAVQSASFAPLFFSALNSDSA